MPSAAPAEMPAERTDDDSPAAIRQRIAPAPTLPRFGLLIVLALVAAVGISVYMLFPDAVGGPELPVATRVDVKMLRAVGSRTAVPVEVVSVENQSDFPIKHLTVIVNGHYQIGRESPLLPRQVLDLPQEIFTNKRSSKRFDPGLYEVHKVVVRGQLPTGTRGVSVFYFGEPTETDGETNDGVGPQSSQREP